jgi:hypothetical protein
VDCDGFATSKQVANPSSVRNSSVSHASSNNIHAERVIKYPERPKLSCAQILYVQKGGRACRMSTSPLRPYSASKATPAALASLPGRHHPKSCPVRMHNA